MSTTESSIDPARLAKLIEVEEAEFNGRHHKSRAMTERASASLAGGVASSWQATDPHPIYLAEGHGSKVIDLDGNEYVDFHNGYGAVAVGHAHPKIVEAVSDVVRKGTHFAQPTEMGVVNAEHLQQRFGLPLWRFGELRHRVHARVRAGDAGLHRPRHPAQDRGLLPRPSRCRDGVGGASGRQDRRLRRSRQRAPDARPAGRLRGPHQGRAVQRSGRAGADARALQGPGRGHDRGAVHDERRLRAARRGLSAGRQGPAPRPRCAAHLRRGQDRCHHPLRRRHQGVRRRARSAGSGQVGRRRRSLWRHRRKRRGDGLDRRGQDRSGRHVQRQSADDGGHARDADRDPDAGRVHRVRAAGRDPAGGLRRRDRAHRHRWVHHRDGGSRRGHLSRRAGAQLPRVPRGLRSAGLRQLALPVQPRSVHGARGASPRTGRCRCSTPRRTCAGTSTTSTSSERHSAYEGGRVRGARRARGPQLHRYPRSGAAPVRGSDRGQGRRRQLQ